MTDTGDGDGRLSGPLSDEPFPLTHPVDVATLSESGGLSFDLKPEASDRELVARYLGLSDPGSIASAGPGAATASL
ncbi:MAG: hypothetical protein AAFW01_12875, partial [Pseudomonadota bacterium]